MKSQLILLTGVACITALSEIDTSHATSKIVNYATLNIRSERNEIITNNYKCNIITGKINLSITNNNAEAVLEIIEEEAYVETLNNDIGTVEQKNGTVKTAINKGTYNQTGGTVDVVENCSKEDDPQPVYSQVSGVVKEITNNGSYVYRGGTVNKITQEGEKASFAVTDNEEFELTGDNVITNGAIVLGTSGENETTGTLTLNNGSESTAKLITNANSQLTVNEGTTINAKTGTNIMTGSSVDVKGTANFIGINNDAENVVTWAGTVNVFENGVFNAINVNEADGIGEDDKTHATLVQTGGTSNINAFVTLGENTNITGGIVNAEGDIGFYGNITTGDNNATLNLRGSDSIFHIKGGTVELDGGNDLSKVNWEGNIFLDGGTLNLKNIIDNSTEDVEHPNKHGFLTARKGKLFLQGDTVLLNGKDYIYDEVNLKVDGNIEVQEDGTLHVSGDDEYKGKMSVNGGQLYVKNITTGGDTYLTTTAGLLEVKEGSKLVLKDDRDQISFNTILDLKGDLEIDNNNETGVTLNNIGTGSDDNWDASVELKKGVLTLENVSKSTTEASKYNQSGGELRLFQTSLTLNEGKINGGIVSFGVPVDNPNGDNNGGEGGGNNNGPLQASPVVMLRAPAKRIKNIEKQRLQSENTGLLRADPNPIRLRADQNSSNLTLNNGEDNNAEVQVSEDNPDTTIKVSGINSNTGTPTTFTFNEGSTIETGNISIGDDNGSANVINTSDNTLISENVAIALKNNTTLSVNGSATQVTFNTDNENAQFDGKLEQTEGTVTLLGTNEKTGVLRSTGGLLNIGNGVTETEVKLNNSNDKVLCNQVKIAPNTTFDFSDNRVSAPMENSGVLKITDSDIPFSISSGGVLTRGGMSGRLLANLEPTGQLEVNGKINCTAEINQATVTVKGGTEFDTTADIKTKDLNIESNVEINVKNANIVSDKMNGNSTNEYKLDNANLFLKDQDADVNGEVVATGDKVILYINDKKFNDCVSIEEGCNTYLASGQIGETHIKWGGRVNVTGAGAGDIGDFVVERGGSADKAGKLVIDKTKNDKVEGDIILGDKYNEVKFRNITIVFDKTQTYHAIDKNIAPGPYFQRTGDGSLILDNSTITIPSIDLLKSMENITLIGSSKLIVGGGNVANFDFINDVTTINGEYDNYDISGDMKIGNNTSNKANFKIDLYARSNSDKKHDTFGSDTAKLVAGNGTDAVINISDWTLHDDIFGKDAPIDRTISMQIFKFGSTQAGHKFTFTSSDKEVLTPIGYYKLNSKGNGLYSFDLTSYNPGVFRGQIVTTAQHQNQLAVSNAIFDHMMAEPSINNSDYMTKKDGTKDRHFWAKLYGGKEKLHLNQNFDVDSNTYGAIFGLDFNPVTSQKGWSFVPTLFGGYNHATQKYNDDYSSRQDGGQLGFATTISNGSFKLGTIVYGGYYTNKMTMPNNVSDKANNWFGGGSIRGAYDIRVSQSVIIRPNISISYNYFNSATWKTEFGNMNMNLGKLNGISATPGVEIVLQRGALGLQFSAQYVHSFDKGVAGQAGNVKLPEVKLKKGYMQYGFGIQSQFSKNFSGSLQATVRHSGRTGFGVRAGIIWKF